MYFDDYYGNDIQDIRDNNGEEVSYTYSGNALTQVQKTFMLALGGETSYSYDSVYTGAVTQISVGVTYSEFGGVTSSTAPVTISYDSNRRLAGIVAQGASSGYTYSHTMDPSNSYIQTTNVVLPDGLTKTFTFDANGYLLSDQTGTGFTCGDYNNFARLK